MSLSRYRQVRVSGFLPVSLSSNTLNTTRVPSNIYPDTMTEFLYRTTLTVLGALVLFLTATDGAYARNADRLKPANTTNNGEHVEAAQYLPGTIVLRLKNSVINNRGHVFFGISSLDRVLETLGADSRRALFPLAPYNNELLAKSASTTDARYNHFDRFYIVTFTNPYTVEWAIQEIMASGAVEFAEPHFVFDLFFTPDDPQFPQQYALDLIEIEKAWDITKGDSTLSIGVVDSGVEWSHEDLTDNIFLNPGETGLDNQGKDRRDNGIDDDNNGFIDDWHGWDFVGHPKSIEEWQFQQWTPDNNPAPRPLNISGYQGYHGTWVSGSASAVTDNGTGVAAPGFRTKILPVKASADSIGTGTVAAGYEGIRYAADMGAKVINASFGGNINAGQLQGLQAVIDYAYDRGALVVAASGNASTNNDRTPQYPAGFDHVLSVGATSFDDAPADFSGYGVSVDVWAPGVAIHTTNIRNLYTAANVSGTSFSSPITAGVAALVFSLHPDWDPDQVAMQLRSTGDHVGASGGVSPYFFRRVNAYRAVSINRDFESENPEMLLPGVGLLSYLINNKPTDTIKGDDDIVTVQLTLKNYLAPTKNLSISYFDNDELATVAPVSVETIGTMETGTTEVQVRIDPDSDVQFSEGSLQLILKLEDGDYEDYVALTVPVQLPGWYQQEDPPATGQNGLAGNSIVTVTPKIAWTISNVQTGQTTFTPFYSRVSDGNSWRQFRQVSMQGNGIQEPLYSIYALDHQLAWAGSGPSSGNAAVFKTTSGGSNWQRSSVATITGFVNSVHFWDAENGIFLGDPRNRVWGIGHTTDGGATWAPLPTLLPALSTDEIGWNNSYAAYGDNLWFGTNEKRIYRSTDRGNTWTPVAAPGTNSFGIAFANEDDGLAVFSPRGDGSGENMITVSHNGGASWQQAPLPFPTATPQGVTFVPGTTRAFVGTQRGVFETSDFGQTWRQMAMPVMEFTSLLLSAAADEETGEVGAYGTNVFSQLMTYKEEGEEEPSSGIEHTGTYTGNATLHQSIPNPTNTTTTIYYELKEAAGVELALYDSRGTKVMVLAEGTTEAGPHSVQLDVSGLPSGTYYYMLDTGAERLIRSLMVIK